MFQKRYLAIFLVVIVITSFVSAGWFSDLFGKNKITGNAIVGEKIVENPKDSAGNGILVSKYYSGKYPGYDDYTLYAGKYCELVQDCTGFKDVIVVDDSAKACRCDSYWGCEGQSCVNDVSQSSSWERVGSVTCTGCQTEEPPLPECIDSDNGASYFIKGKTCLGEDCKEDYCIDSFNAMKYSCRYYNNEQTSYERINSSYSCPSTYSCSDGRCIKSDVVPVCGNGVLESGEECDTTNLNGKNCISEGYDSGTLKCNSACKFDYSECLKEISNWTPWLNRDYPGGNGDYETLKDFLNSGYDICKNPSNVEYRRTDGKNVSQKIHVGNEIGFYCLNSENPEGCANYEVRFYCGNYSSLCGNGLIESGEECDDGNLINGDGCSNKCILEHSLLNITISVATLKNSYLIGEQINLTDPPEILNSNIEDYSENSNAFSSLNLQNNSTSNISEKPVGYIVEFEDNPLVVEKKDLNEKATANQKYIQESVPYNPVRIYKQLFSIKPEDVDSRIVSYSEELDNSNKAIKQRIADLERSGKITGNAISNENSLEVENEFKNSFNGVYLNISANDAEEIKKVRGVKAVYPNYKVYATLEDSVPLINADDVWKLDEDGNDCLVSGKDCLTGKGIKIAIIDTGVDYNHKDLGGCFGEGCKVVGGYDFVNQDNDPIDDMGHGTHVAATAAGNGTLKGVAPDAEIYAFKVLDNFGSGSTENIISAIEKSIDLDNDGIIMENKSDYVDILSMSLGGQGDPDDPQSLAIDNVVSSGIVAVVAAGNDGPSEQTIGSPGAARGAITVAASDKSDNIAYFSSRGPIVWVDSNGDEQAILKPDITAPGVDICAAQSSNKPWNDRKCLDDEHIAISGTSMATPHVAGVVALLKQKNPDWTPEEIKNSLKATAVDLGENSIKQGAGRVDALATVKLSEPAKQEFDFFVYKELSTNNIYDSLELKGVFPEDFDFLNIEWKGEEEVWRTDGIKVIGKGLILAEFNPNGNIIGSGNYEFRVNISREGIEKSDILNVYFDSRLEKGWPIELEQGSLYYPIFSDLSNDSIDNLIISTGHPSGLLYVFNQEGNVLDGWPKKTDDFAPLGYPTVADLNGDGKNEIIIFSGASVAGNPGGDINSFVHAFDLEGNELKGFPIKIDFSEPYLYSTIADLNGDGKNEIIVLSGGVVIDTSSGTVSFSNKVYVINGDGKFIDGWPIETSQGLRPNSGASLADLNGDGKLDIIFGTSNISDEFGQSNLEAFSYNGSLIQGFPKTIDGAVERNIISGDIDKDGYTEIFLNTILSKNPGLKVFRYKNGSLEDYCNITNSRKISVADLNHDSNLKIISTSMDSVDVFDSSCNKIWSVYVPGQVYSQPIISNIVGDSKEEILVVSYGEGLFAFDSKGNLLEGFPIPLQGFGTDLSVGNINSNPNVELVATSGSESKSFIYLFDFDTIYNQSTMSWPMSQHDSQHTGSFSFLMNASIPEPNLPQSKIVNNINDSIVGNLIMILQKNISGVWTDEKIVTNQSIIISGNSLIKLDIGKDYGWNLKNVNATSTGEYRVYILFESSGQKFETSWEFEVE